MRNRILLCLIAAGMVTAAGPSLHAQQQKEQANQEANIEAYIDLLRANVKTQKTQLIGAVMQFTPEEASLFWPIYKEYDTELTKLGDQKLAVIREYADHYGRITDEKADELVRKFLDVKSQRDALLRKCYEQIRSKMGGKEAARFIQVENQLLLLIDLQIASQLPAVE